MLGGADGKKPAACTLFRIDADSAGQLLWTLSIGEPVDEFGFDRQDAA